MRKVYIPLICCLVYVTGSVGQSGDLDEFLSSVQLNNVELKALRSQISARGYDMRSTNRLPDPQMKAYYLPLGGHSGGDYLEFEVTQQFDWPGSYEARKKWIGGRSQSLELEYESKRQELLLQAKSLAISMIHYRKQTDIVNDRLTKAREILASIQFLYDKGEKSVLDLNKARIALLELELDLDHWRSGLTQVSEELKVLNGGTAFQLEVVDYPDTLLVQDSAALWNDYEKMDARLKWLEQKKQAAIQNIELEKKLKLPGFTLGVNHQGVRGEQYSGLAGGVQIPLWRGKDKVLMAEAQADFQDMELEATRDRLYGEFVAKYARYRSLHEKYRDYRAALHGLAGEEVLEKAFNLGQISYLDYYRELAFYRDAENRLLEIEKDLQILQTELNKFKL
jgi:outer membrane protein TolC